MKQVMQTIGICSDWITEAQILMPQLNALEHARPEYIPSLAQCTLFQSAIWPPKIVVAGDASLQFGDVRWLLELLKTKAPREAHVFHLTHASHLPRVNVDVDSNVVEHKVPLDATMSSSEWINIVAAMRCSQVLVPQGWQDTLNIKEGLIQRCPDVQLHFMSQDDLKATVIELDEGHVSAYVQLKNLETVYLHPSQLSNEVNVPIHFHMHLKTLGKLEVVPQPYQTTVQDKCDGVDRMVLEQQLVDQVEALGADVLRSSVSTDKIQLECTLGVHDFTVVWALSSKSMTILCQHESTQNRLHSSLRVPGVAVRFF